VRRETVIIPLQKFVINSINTIWSKQWINNSHSLNHMYISVGCHSECWVFHF
jgi:hypothetical protein